MTQDELEFQGRVLSVQDRSERLTLCLPEGGRVRYAEYSLEADGPSSVNISKRVGEIVVYTALTARRLKLRVPGVAPEKWEESSQNALRVKDDSLLISVPQGWHRLRLLAPKE